MSAPPTLFPRLLKPAIQAALKDTPVVAVLGPRQSGKTTLVQQMEPERMFVSLDDKAMRDTAMADPDGFIRSLPETVTIDEIQRAPELMPSIKLEVDKDQSRRPGRFLLTGSANLLLLPTVTESLAGRMEIVELSPLTEAEKERQSGRFLETLLVGGFEPGPGAAPLPGKPTLAERLVAGGYPNALTRMPDRARRWHRQYVKAIIDRDLPNVAGVTDADRLHRLLVLFSRPNAQLFNASGLARSVGLHRNTVNDYVHVLQRLYLLRRLPAWHNKAVRRDAKTPKIHFLDSGLAATLADLSANDWISRRDLMGHLLESFVVQQLAAQARWSTRELELWHYRDRDQIEVDLVIVQGHRIWGIEVKAGQNPTGGGRGLARLADRCGKDFEFQSGIVLHSGQHSLPLPDRRMLAVPLHELWTR